MVDVMNEKEYESEEQFLRCVIGETDESLLKDAELYGYLLKEE